MEEYLSDAIELVNNSVASYCHYITPNDLGITGGHQCGFYFPHAVEPMFYGEFQHKGQNNDCHIIIRWQKEFTTNSRAVYYGTGTRNENRITRFGKVFEFMNDKYLGSLQILTKNEDGEYDCYVLSNQDNIDAFVATFSLDITARNQIIKRGTNIRQPEDKITDEINAFIYTIDSFPPTDIMAEVARNIVSRAYGYQDKDIESYPDKILPQWINSEYLLFKSLENKVYARNISQPFIDCQSLIDFASSILNRRKSRAGKSLEHHLSTIFRCSNLKFESQCSTEANKRPDFIFPDGECYHNIMFPADKLIMLGAKTTCKDRWRQVLNEADRISHKHLFTLQQGVSKNQLEEMKMEHLTLVVPQSNISMFHPEYHDNIMSISKFCQMVREKQK